MSFKVVNLANLFWDNGSFKYPNTYPRLIGAKTVDKTPIMTSPTTGWVILEGDYNYCEFNEELFFLKKSYVISHKRNKWTYILIKDHICNIFKNKANVKAKGTIVNADLKQLKEKDFQFTFPVFNNFNKRILIPLTTEKYNWKKHTTFGRPKKEFESYKIVTDKNFSEFVTLLENNQKLLLGGNKQWNNEVKNNKQLVLLGRIGRSTSKERGWKNELVDKIKQLFDDIESGTRDDIVLGKISQASISGVTKLNGKWAISYTSQNPLFTVTSDDTREVDVDLSGLTDIELINLDSAPEGQQFAKDNFNLFLSYDQNLVTDSRLIDEADPTTFICKLSRRVRLPILSEYSSRAVYKRGGILFTTKWSGFTNDNSASFFYPQKVFFKLTTEQDVLKPQGKYSTHYPRERYKETYRSVYLYWVFNWNFYLVWNQKNTSDLKNFGDTWLSAEQYFKEKKEGAREKSRKGNQYLDLKGQDDIFLIPKVGEGKYFYGSYNIVPRGNTSIIRDEYQAYYPWTKSGDSNAGEPINIGWLLGQFSSYIRGQDNQFESEFPYIVKTGKLASTENKLKRLKGLKPLVSKMIHLEDVYSNARTGSQWTLTLFDYLPARTIEKNKKEEDFLIGEKMLTSCWGMAPLLLFQPTSFSFVFGDPRGGVSGAYGWFYDSDIFDPWLNTRSWSYNYYVFDSGSYYTQKAREAYKKADSNFTALTPYKRFYQTPTNYKELKKHIINNTEAYFQTDEVTLKNTPLKELKIGDIFYSDDEWFWFNQSREGFGHYHESDFLVHRQAPEISGGNKIEHGDIVAYLNPKDNKVYMGQALVWEEKMQLPDGQYITNNPSEDSSSSNTITPRYTRLTPLTSEFITSETFSGYESMQVLIDALKVERFLKKVNPNNLQELINLQRNFLFNLKGTPFWCLLDRYGRVSLIFKNKEEYEDSEFVPD